MPHALSPRLCFALVSMIALSASPLRAQTAPAAQIDPRAQSLLRQMCQTLTSAKAFTFHLSSTTDELAENGQKLQFARNAAIEVRRPDAIRAIVKGDVETYDFFYNGKSVHFFDPAANEYITLPAGNDIDSTLDELANRDRIVFPLADLVMSDPCAALTSRVQSGGYVGLHLVDGTPCHHLAFRSQTVDWQIWIESSSNHPRHNTSHYDAARTGAANAAEKTGHQKSIVTRPFPAAGQSLSGVGRCSRTAASHR